MFFEVVFRRLIDSEGTVSVEADNAKEAKAKAVEMLNNEDKEISWQMIGIENIRVDYVEIDHEMTALYGD